LGNISATAVFGEKGDESVDCGEVGTVNKRSPLTPAHYQSRILELRQVERKRGGRQAHAPCNLSGGQACRTRDYEQAEDAETGFPGESFESDDGAGRFHISNIMEIL
jgi:hypothetical protein